MFRHLSRVILRQTMVAGPLSYWTTPMITRDFRIPERADAVTQRGRLLFRYYKDCYAAMLLEDLLQPRLPIRILREGRYGRLLDRPSIKALVASKGDGWLDRDDLLMLWPCETETYVVTFATWGSAERRDQRWHQISRPRPQLVLQLNFPHRHDAEYRRCRMPRTCPLPTITIPSIKAAALRWRAPV